MDMPTPIWTESSVATIPKTIDVTDSPQMPEDLLFTAHTTQHLGADSHGGSLPSLSSPSGPSSQDDTTCGDVSPKASSSLPPSSMPTSPATSLGPSSPCKSGGSPEDSSQSSPVALSPRFMSVDNSRSSSPVKTSPRRLVASSPPPSSILGKRTGSEVSFVDAFPVKCSRAAGRTCARKDRGLTPCETHCEFCTSFHDPISYSVARQWNQIFPTTGCDYSASDRHVAAAFAQKACGSVSLSGHSPEELASARRSAKHGAGQA